SRVLVDDLLNDGESQSGAFRFRGDVRLERMREHVLGKPGAAIAKREYRLSVAGRQRDIDLRLVLPRLCIDGVLQQIVEHLAKPGWLALNHDRRVGQREGDMRAQIV